MAGMNMITESSPGRKKERTDMKSSLKSILTMNFAILFMILIPAVFLRAQSVIENPAKPSSANAGRVITLKEVQRIHDQEGKFFFKEPLEILIGKDGCVYVQEYRQFLKFDPAGQFVKNLHILGQGPGEINDNVNSVLIDDKEILLFSSNICKAVRMSLQGNAIKDLTFPKFFLDLVAKYKGIYFFTQNEMPPKGLDRKPGIKEWNYRLVKVDGNGAVVPTSTLLSLKYSLITAGRGVVIMNLNKLECAQADDRYVFLNHTPEYLVKILDLESGEIVKSFRREYPRVQNTIKDASNSPFKSESPKYHNDICHLLMRRDKLWIVTSTFDKKKGVLIDVYDRDGKYLDNFYLPLMNFDRREVDFDVCMAISRDFLYVIEEGEDGSKALVKYEIHGA